MAAVAETANWDSPAGVREHAGFPRSGLDFGDNLVMCHGTSPRDRVTMPAYSRAASATISL